MKTGRISAVYRGDEPRPDAQCHRDCGEHHFVIPPGNFPDGSREVGALSLATISQRAGVAIPTSNSPFVAPIGDQIVLDGSPLHIGLDGYDPNGGPLTYTVVSSNPSIVQPTVLTGNRSAKISVAGWGDMVFQLFEQQVPDATGRFITLAQSGFYDAANNNPDITVHRVIDNFMLQFGDPTGTGSGGSTLGDFDDDFTPTSSTTRREHCLGPSRTTTRTIHRCSSPTWRRVISTSTTRTSDN